MGVQKKCYVALCFLVGIQEGLMIYGTKDGPWYFPHNEPIGNPAKIARGQDRDLLTSALAPSHKGTV